MKKRKTETVSREIGKKVQAAKRNNAYAGSHVDDDVAVGQHKERAGHGSR